MVVTGIGLLGWYVWLPGYRPGLQRGESYGIDVSNHQGRIDWSRVRRAGVRFAYIKATEGSTYVDSDFSENLAAAKSAGLEVGAYHFFTLCSSGASQAANFLATSVPGTTTLPPAVDLELTGNCSARPSLPEVQAQLTAYVALVQKATQRSVIMYIGDSFDDRYPMPMAEESLRWKRRVLRRPTSPWVIWQVNGRAHVNGVDGSVDLDVGRVGDLATPAASPPG